MSDVSILYISVSSGHEYGMPTICPLYAHCTAGGYGMPTVCPLYHTLWAYSGHTIPAHYTGMPTVLRGAHSRHTMNIYYTTHYAYTTLHTMIILHDI